MSNDHHRDSQPADRSTPKRNALVFGATGFIGRWLVKELLDQHIRPSPQSGPLHPQRYPTEPANALATAHGLHHSDISTALQRWSEHLTGQSGVTNA